MIYYYFVLNEGVGAPSPPIKRQFEETKQETGV